MLILVLHFISMLKYKLSKSPDPLCLWQCFYGLLKTSELLQSKVKRLSPHNRTCKRDISYDFFLLVIFHEQRQIKANEDEDGDYADDDDDDVHIMMRCVSVTRNHHFPA